MQIGLPKENHPGETRVAFIPEHVKKLCALGAEVLFEPGLGFSCHHEDAHYEQAGAKKTSREKIFASANLILKLRSPNADDLAKLPAGAIHISYLDPFQNQELIKILADKKISAISMELIPRTTKAQKMDALSSQASLAGYAAVILAAERINKIFPMMTTPSGTIFPCKVFIVGAGVAGLQAIATAHRLGARVQAFDTRPVVEEQVRSLGGKFVKIDLGQTGQTAQGYARELTAEQIKLQQEGMKKICADSDVVITTAQVFGRRAPLIITKDMITAMKPGSVIVDLAVESGGNVEGAQVDQELDIGGVKLVGVANMPGRVALDASRMYSSNLFNLVQEYWNKETKQFVLKPEDEIIKACLLTHEGGVLWKAAH